MFCRGETLLIDVPAGAESDFFDDVSVILFSAYFFDEFSGLPARMQTFLKHLHESVDYSREW